MVMIKQKHKFNEYCTMDKWRTKGYCFGFEGPPGVGKTTFAKKGLLNVY
jgi:ATP-dependent Lon protease